MRKPWKASTASARVCPTSVSGAASPVVTVRTAAARSPALSAVTALVSTVGMSPIAAPMRAGMESDPTSNRSQRCRGSRGRLRPLSSAAAALAGDLGEDGIYQLIGQEDAEQSVDRAAEAAQGLQHTNDVGGRKTESGQAISATAEPAAPPDSSGCPGNAGVRAIAPALITAAVPAAKCERTEIIVILLLPATLSTFKLRIA